MILVILIETAGGGLCVVKMKLAKMGSKSELQKTTISVKIFSNCLPIIIVKYCILLTTNLYNSIVDKCSHNHSLTHLQTHEVY